ncbi:MAG: hypothetical protein CMP68_00125 [Flavobacteriales bacterium]|nr:hypothetical protein [Flavobacteriales bacterium]
MSKYVIYFLFFSFFVSAQNLPDQYYFSDDNRLIRGGVDFEDLYDEHEIKNIYLYFDQPNYWDQLHDNYCEKINIPATLIFDGETYDEVGVRFKGQTSYFNTNGSNGGGPGNGPGGSNVDTDKKSFNIEIDWVHDQDIDGYETLNLNNCYQDPSFLREFLFEKLSRKYLPSVQVNYVKLFINDQDWGIYPNVQQLDKKHADQWFFNNECTRWRAEDPNITAPGCGGNSGGPGGGSPGGGGPGGGPNFGAGTSSLNFLGVDTALYQDHYTLKKSYVENPWSNLVYACNAIDNIENVENPYDYLNQYLDLDATLWHLAVEIIFSDDDSYINKGGMDYYIYYDLYNERILPIEYDGNTVFGNSNWSPFYNENDSDFALINKLLSIPDIRQRYLAHFRTILVDCFDSDYINELIDNYAALIDQNVLDDPKKIYSYNEFLYEIEEIKNYFFLRKNYLLNNIEVNNFGVEIQDVNFSVNDIQFNQPSSIDPVKVTASVESIQDLDEVNIFYGTGLSGVFEKNTMDLIDGNFSFIIPPQLPGTYVRFYVESVSSSGSKFYKPSGAEHDVYIYQVQINELVDSDLVINEIMASNDNTVADEYGDYDDWIEIYNNGVSSINLNGHYLSDDVSNLTKYIFPDYILEPNEYFIVWADDDEEDQGDFNHATFKLSAAGESIYLSDLDLNILDNCIFPEQQTDLAYARIPNGSGEFIIQEATFSYNNEQESSLLSDNMERKLMKTIDLLGKKSKQKMRGIFIEIYDDYSVVKKINIE